MRGAYLIAILISAAGIAALDLRHRLALRPHPGRTVATVVIGVVFFLLWDAVGIITGVFVKGEGSALLGVTLAPELPLEEPVFLAFLCYLALVAYAGAMRWLGSRAGGSGEGRPSSGSEAQA